MFYGKERSDRHCPKEYTRMTNKNMKAQGQQGDSEGAGICRLCQA